MFRVFFAITSKWVLFDNNNSICIVPVVCFLWNRLNIHFIEVLARKTPKLGNKRKRFTERQF